jgi:hypothetical protein
MPHQADHDVIIIGASSAGLRRVASIPSIRGIRTSISTTSGHRRRASSTSRAQRCPAIDLRPNRPIAMACRLPTPLSRQMRCKILESAKLALVSMTTWDLVLPTDLLYVNWWSQLAG